MLGAADQRARIDSPAGKGFGNPGVQRLPSQDCQLGEYGVAQRPVPELIARAGDGWFDDGVSGGCVQPINQRERVQAGHGGQQVQLKGLADDAGGTQNRQHILG